MNNHDIVILIVILVIVIFQAVTFISSLKKINRMRSIFPPVKHFSIVKVPIPEAEISYITPEEAFKNRDIFQIISTENKQSTTVTQHNLQELNENYFFYESPDEFGIFSNEVTNPQKKIRAWFIVDGVEYHQGHFWINNGAIETNQIKANEKKIKLACEIQGNITNPSRIETIEPGMVERIDTFSWRIIKKARIKLI